MCGIAGVIGNSALDPASVGAMISALAYRGPDDEGAWFDSEAAIALGHRRLSIIDLSPAGHQPMQSADGRFVLVLNGEIYNFRELRESLEQQGLAPPDGWRGHSDAEVFLEGIARWGLDMALSRSAGMFAFALWDRHERRLTLVRDRFGEKPLYYGWVGSQFVFGSELKALRAHPEFDNAISRRSASVFASRGYIPAPLSIYERIYKLPAACSLEITPEGARRPLDCPIQQGESSHGIRLNSYWSYGDVVGAGLDDPISDDREALEQLEHALGQAVRQQSLADVPVGAFLSGGIDSSLVVSLMRQHSSTSVRTFSIGFNEPAYNEADDAKAFARHLNTLHSEQYVTSRDALDLIPALPSMYDEPFADPSQIATHLVSRLARQDVSVALTGDGGDELFAGYYHHLLAPRVWNRLQSFPGPARAMVINGLSRIPRQFWTSAAALMARRNQSHIGPKIQRALRAAAKATNLDEIHRSLQEEWDFGESPVLGGNALVDIEPGGPECAEGTVRLMYLDAMSYLPDDILCKVDRASMSIGLETRAPFLDHRVATVAARIPLSMKVRNGRGKFILRTLLNKHVPPQLAKKPKNGFAVPVGEWIKGPLRAWAEELLDPRSIRAEGWFDADLVASRWRAHLSGRCDSTAAIWAVLMFQSWVREHQ